MPGTHAAYVSDLLLVSAYAHAMLSPPQLSSYALPTRCPVLTERVVHRRASEEMAFSTSLRSISLRSSYAMSSTDTASPSISLRACYAMSGTDIA
eukprot:1084305-Rhodomonas_salina.4